MYPLTRFVITTISDKRSFSDLPFVACKIIQRVSKRIMSQDTSSPKISDVVLKPLNRFGDDRGWLIELYREDELSESIHPVMAYISQTLPGIVRGPHEHHDQTDYFAFIGPSDFELTLWDARSESPTFGVKS